MLPSLYQLKRHPLLIRAHFKFTLVLTYAFPSEILRPLLPPGLTLDERQITGQPDIGFVAIALVETDHMRPDFLPAWAGSDFFLSGYRIFSRFQSNNGHNLRGLRILRSDTDSALMAMAGNMLTHYQYQHSKITRQRTGDRLTISVASPDGKADLELETDLAGPEELPAGSCFEDKRDALKFAGPLPFTFNYESETNSIIRVEGVREEWHPRLITANVKKATYFDQPPFASAEGGNKNLVSAFYLEGIPYYWKPGIVEKVQQKAAEIS